MNKKSTLLALKLLPVGLSIAGCSNAATLAPTPTIPTPASPSTPAAPARSTNPLQEPSAKPSRSDISLGTSTSLSPTLTATATRPTPLPSQSPLPNREDSKIAYTSCTGNDLNSCEVYVMNADGSAPVRLTHNSVWDGSPDWSPDGIKLVFESDLAGNGSEIYTMDADGSNLTRLTNNTTSDTSPAWSPNGNRIAFVSAPDLASTGHRGGSLASLLRGVAHPGAEVFVMNVDGSDPLQLTNNGATNYGPAWSPDSKRILFISDMEGCARIFVMDADGSNQARFAYPCLSLRGRDLSWSLDGLQIAFVDYAEIFVMDVEIRSLSGQLTRTDASEESPDWSPDGTKLVFAQGNNGRFQVYVMNADGSGKTILTRGPANNFSPAWGPATESVLNQHPISDLPDCTSGWTRLSAGGQAKVSAASTTPNRVREGPSTAQPSIALLYPGSVVKLLEGPICAEGLVFWKVHSTLIPGGVGWTAEGDEADYFLEPSD